MTTMASENYQPHGCLHNRLFRRRSKKISNLRVTGLLYGEFTGTGEFPAQRASDAENVSIRWRYHDQRLPRNVGDLWDIKMYMLGRLILYHKRQSGDKMSPRWFWIMVDHLIGLSWQKKITSILRACTLRYITTLYKILSIPGRFNQLPKCLSKRFASNSLPVVNAIDQPETQWPVLQLKRWQW